MQYPFSVLPAPLAAIQRTLSPARLARYLSAARGDWPFALRLYIWNIRLCEALYLPLQFAEVSARNAIKIPVEKRFGIQWFANHKFLNLLPPRMKDEIAYAIRMELSKTRAAPTQDHIIANLSLGFWAALMTSSYDKHLWMQGVSASFPNALPTEDRQAIYVRLDDMRRFRNDVAHHVAIFDRHPQREFQNALRIIEMVCKDTHWLATHLSRVSTVVNERPPF